MTRRAAWTRAALLTVAVVAVDQVAKALVRADIPLGDRVEVLPFLDLVHTRNDGIAFGALGGSWIVIVLVVAALGGIVAVFAANATMRWAWLPTGLLLGGALGNIVDRVLDGGVTDFIKVPHWPQFNLADASITVGVLALLLVMHEDRDR